MTRHSTDPGYSCQCQYCVHHIARLDARLEVEQEYGTKHGKELIELRAEVRELREKRARSEGGKAEREKTRDWLARALGAAGAGGASYEILSRLLGG